MALKQAFPTEPSPRDEYRLRRAIVSRVVGHMTRDMINSSVQSWSEEAKNSMEYVLQGMIRERDSLSELIEYTRKM
jgi:hypothetical protein